MTLTGKEKLFLLYKMMYLVKVPKTQLIISSPPHPTIPSTLPAPHNTEMVVTHPGWGEEAKIDHAPTPM